MKILAVMGSPHKGSSYSAVKIIEDELKKSGATVEYLFLKDAKLHMCVGCFQCLQKGKEKCPHKDDRDMIIDKMLEADGVIFSSPVYVMHVTGIMKNFIDRLAFLCHRPLFFRQHALCVANTGAIGTKDVTKYLAMWTGVIGFRTSAQVGVRTNPVSIKEITPDAEKKLRKAAQRFLQNIKKNPSPSLSSVIQFRVQRAVFNQPDIAIDLPADRAHYKRLAKMKYNIKTDVEWWKSAIAWVVEKMAPLFFK